jgi:hypothetical protein
MHYIILLVWLKMLLINFSQISSHLSEKMGFIFWQWKPAVPERIRYNIIILCTHRVGVENIDGVGERGARRQAVARSPLLLHGAANHVQLKLACERNQQKVKFCDQTQ